MRRIISVLTIAVMVIMAQVPASYAADKAHTITGFKPLKQTEYYYEGEPEEAELAAALPTKLFVYVKSQKEAVKIPVSWKTIEDFDDTEYYFYSMKPVWPKEYKLSKDLDPVTDVPWVTMFRQVTEEEMEQGEKALDIPASDAKQVKSSDSKGASNKKGSSNNADKTYKYLTEKLGLNMAAACGVMTNLYAESGIQPNNLENQYNIAYGLSDSEYTKRVNKGKKKSKKGKYTSGFGKTRYFTTDYSGYGICQWTTSGRRTKVLNAAVKKDVSIANLNMQLGVLKSELKKDYPQVWATLQGVPNNATGVYLSAAHFCASFEIPANTSNTAASRARTALSTYWKSYSGKSASATGKSYMGLCGYSYPKTIKKGTGMTVSGQVISNYNVKSVTAKIVNSKGKSVYSKTKKPGCKIYSLFNFDGSMQFRKLSSGTYTYIIKAKDSFGKTITVKHEFTVASDNKAETLRGCAVKDVSTSAK